MVLWRSDKTPPPPFLSSLQPIRSCSRLHHRISKQYSPRWDQVCRAMSNGCMCQRCVGLFRVSECVSTLHDSSCGPPVSMSVATEGCGWRSEWVTCGDSPPASSPAWLKSLRLSSYLPLPFPIIHFLCEWVRRAGTQVEKWNYLWMLCNFSSIYYGTSSVYFPVGTLKLPPLNKGHFCAKMNEVLLWKSQIMSPKMTIKCLYSLASATQHL